LAHLDKPSLAANDPWSGGDSVPSKKVMFITSNQPFRKWILTCTPHTLSHSIGTEIEPYHRWVEVMWFNFKPSMLIQRPMSFQAEPGLRKWSGFNLNPSMSIQWMMSSPTEPGYILKWRWELLELGIEGVAWGQSRGQWWRRGAGLAQHTGRQKGCRRQGRWVSGWHRDEQRYDWKEDCQFVTEATDLHPRIQHQRNWTHNIIISTNFIKFTRRIVDWVRELADYSCVSIHDPMTHTSSSW
jgi:hypothetical protein